MLACRICHKPKPEYFFRCAEHYLCDDCGTRDALCTYTEGVLCGPCHDKRVEKRIAEFRGDTDYTQEVVCPNCGYTYSDSFEMSEGNKECPDCGLLFEMTKNVEVTYSTEKAKP